MLKIVSKQIFDFLLLKTVKYYARGKTRTQTFYRTGEVSPRGVEVNQKRIVRMSLRIPPNPPTDETTCGIIKISYHIYVRLCYFTLETEYLLNDSIFDIL